MLHDRAVPLRSKIGYLRWPVTLPPHTSLALGLALLGLTVASVSGCTNGLERAEVGPLVGHVGPVSARIWMQGDPGAAYTVIARADGAENAGAIVAFDARGDAYDTACTTIDGLRPDTRYEYTVRRTRGEDASVHTGSFRTAPTPGTPTRFKLVTASCIRTRPWQQRAWPRVLEERPDLMLLLGDNAYANSTDPARVVRAHRRVRAMPGFAAVVRQVPTYAIWDDHDYGRDGSGGEVPNKAELLHAFRAVWPNPGAGTPDAPGAFFRFQRGDVEFFVLDGRYERVRRGSRNNASTRMLGPAQWAWLEEGLLASDATFRVIASGTTLDEFAIDTWRMYPRDRQRLRDLVDRLGIEGVIYLSGDVHYCALRTHAPTSATGYPLTEVISSGIANSMAQGFVVLEFDTTLDDPQVVIRIVSGNGRERRVLRRSELTCR